MEKKKFLFVSIDGYIADTAWRVVLEGHDVRICISDERETDIGDGFVPKTKDWKQDVDWADVIIFDDTLGQGKIAQTLRKQGKLVVGGTPYSDRMEDDRAFGQEEMRLSKIPTIPSQSFTSFDEAIAFVNARPTRYVVKPSGNIPSIKQLLFVGEEDDGQDVLRVLEAYKKTWGGKMKSFQLQRRVMGVEVAVGAFFNGKEFLYPININFEHKKLFPGNIGPSTGEMGTLCFWSEPNRLFSATLKRVEPRLREEQYVGYVDLNCIVNGSGIFPLEWTMRFGYPTIFIQQEGMSMPVGEFLYRMAAGESFQIKTKRGFQVGVRIAVPPYPFHDEKTFEAYSKDAVIVFERPHEDGVHFEDAKRINGSWMIAGSSGVALTVVGTGTTVKQAQQQAYSRVKNILIPNMYYRTDIGDRWVEDSDKLHNWGYLREE